jgi:hypothetical protein
MLQFFESDIGLVWDVMGDCWHCWLCYSITGIRKVCWLEPGVFGEF